MLIVCLILNFHVYSFLKFCQMSYNINIQSVASIEEQFFIMDLSCQLSPLVKVNVFYLY